MLTVRRATMISLLFIWPLLVFGESYGPTSSGDTLWKVADRMRTDANYSTKEMMLAIFLANREAFSNDNINRLKKGQLLQGPSEDELREVSLMNVAEQFQKYSGNSSSAGRVGGGGDDEVALREAEQRSAQLDAENDNLETRYRELQKQMEALQDRSAELKQKLSNFDN